MKTLTANEIKVGNRFRKNPGDLPGLSKSIAELGMLHPVVIDVDHNLVAGWRRLKAWEMCYPGKPVPITVVTSLDSALSHLLAEKDENTCREDPQASEKIILGLQIEKLEKPRAKERQRAGQEKGRNRSQTVPGNLPATKRSDTRDVVGKGVGMSGKTFEKGKAVVEAAARNPEKYGDLVDLMDPHNDDEGKKKAGSVAYAHDEFLRRSGKPVKPKKQPKQKRIDAAVKAVWDEARKDIRTIDMIALRNAARVVYIEIIGKEPK